MKQESSIDSEAKRILMMIKTLAPGKSVEVRIPGIGAIQCVKGINHRRGTPPNLVEMSGDVLIKVTQEPEKWDEYCHMGLILASGPHSNMYGILKQTSTLLYVNERYVSGK